MDKPNLLILPQGYKKWNEQQDRITPGKFKRKFRAEIGYQPTKVEERPEGETAPFDGYVVPKSFCPDCGLTDITNERLSDGRETQGAPGVWILEEPRPDLRLQPGDQVFFWICHKCAHSDIWENRFLSSAPRSKELIGISRQAHRMNNLQSWLKWYLVRGGEPIRRRNV